MRSLCTHFLVLIVYLLLVFVISRLIDFALWFQHGITSTQVVDPLLLSVRQLKQLLENRGVSYTGCVEKKELAELVDASAEVTQNEVSRLADNEVRSAVPQPARFTGGTHFYEQVEDTKDSVWLVQVVPADGEPLLDDLSWHVVRSHIAPFAIRTGVFDCNLDRRLCSSKGWHEPLLLLALPKGTRPKDRVILRTFTLTRPQAIVEWVREQLAIRVKKVETIEEVQSEWIASNSGHHNVRVLLLTHLLHPPLFLAALSVKFTGRVKFGIFTVKKQDADAVRKKLGLLDNRLPAYIVITPERKLVYGQRKFEHFNFASMNLFLRTVQPETNDIFLCSLLIVNLLVSIRMLQVTVKLWWKHLAQCLWILISYNFWLFSMWLLILAVYRFPAVSLFLDGALVLVRELNLTEVAATVRSDLWSLYQHPYLLAVSLATYLAVAAFFTHEPQSNPEAEFSDPRSSQTHASSRPWWEVLPVGSYWVDCFFRPAATLSVTTSPTDFELEEGIEMLIERLAVPNLWLQPSVIPSDYIKELPIWRFRNDNDYKSEAENCCSSSKNGTSRKPSYSTVCPNSPEVITCVMDCEEPGNVMWESSQLQHPTNCKCSLVQRDDSSEGEDSSSTVTSDEYAASGCWRDSAPAGSIGVSDCAVCLEQYSDRVVLCGLPCGHFYHRTCILTWLTRDNHHCPVCRWPAYRSKPLHAHAE